MFELYKVLFGSEEECIVGRFTFIRKLDGFFLLSVLFCHYIRRSGDSYRLGRGWLLDLFILTYDCIRFSLGNELHDDDN